MTERDEFLLSQLLDGDLSEQEERSLRDRLRTESDLDAAWRSMSKVEDLLRARATDIPRIDFARLHRDVMAGIQAESRPMVIRLRKWMQFAVPLAAAAAIALVVSLNRPGVRPQGPAPGGPPIEIAKITPPAVQPQEAGHLAVRFSRPEAADATAAIRVSYTRSTELAKAMEERDTERRSRPTYHLYVVDARQSDNRDDFFVDTPPL